MYNKPKTDKEIESLRKSGQILQSVMQQLGERIGEGVTGVQLDNFAREEIIRQNATPSLIGYIGYQHTLCISVNDAVVHGIPSSVPFKNGDVVGIDFCVTYEGMVTDATRTFVVGGIENISKAEQNLITQTSRALDAGIQAVKNGASIGDVSAAIQDVLDKGGYGIVRDLVGHGVGHEVHEGPEVPNYGVAGTGPKLKTGMTIAIEPMATLGDWKVVMDPDGWTVRTRDGSLSAHFEDTVLVTKDGCEIVTR